MLSDKFGGTFAIVQTSVREVQQHVFNWLVVNPQPGPGNNPAVAAILSIAPGAGHIYLGQRAKGLILLLTAFPLFVLTIPLCIIDAVVLARRLRRGKAITGWECFWHPEAQITVDVWGVNRIIKRGRTDETIGAEERLIDNSKSGSKLIRNLKVSREWTYSYAVEHEKAHTITNTTNIQIRHGMAKNRSVEDVLRDKFAYSYGTKHTYAEDVQIEVPPFKRVRVLLKWKNILEVGTIVLQNQRGERIDLPFSIVVGVTFDQAQLDG